MQRLDVTTTNISDVLRKFSSAPVLAFDTETTGLKWYRDDRLFSIQLCDGTHSAYFNFQHYEGIAPELVLDRAVVLAQFQDALFKDPSRVWIGANPGYDHHILQADGCKILGSFYCVLTQEAVLYNQHKSYSLAAVAERRGFAKDESVTTYIDEHDLFRKELLPNGEYDKVPEYNRVPYEIIVPYGLTDVEVTWKLHELQQADLLEMGNGEIPVVSKIENKTTMLVNRMEHTGVKIDIPYVKEALAYDTEKLTKAADEWRKLVGVEFVDSGKAIAPILKSQYGIDLPLAPDGGPSVAGWILEDLPPNPLIDLIFAHRESTKRASTYFSNMLKYADSNGVLHPQFKQRGAYATGRMSGNSPNFQNITQRKKDDPNYPIRRAVVPFPGGIFVELDYKAQEFRLLVEYGKEYSLAERISGGYDPHQAVADDTGMGRDHAKILNFGIPYFMGLAKLGKQLNCSQQEAKFFKAKWFHRAPGIKQFLYKAKDIAEARGYVYGWDGARFYFPDPKLSYKAGNGIIQGGCATITKAGLCNVMEYIQEKQLRSRILVAVHDSGLLWMPESEMSHIKDFQRGMAEAFPFKILAMDTDVKYSSTSWHDMSKEAPGGSTN